LLQAIKRLQQFITRVGNSLTYQLLINDRLDFRRLLTEKEGVSKLKRWWIRNGRLEQFQLVNELIR
jgi:hypothetical protein